MTHSQLTLQLTCPSHLSKQMIVVGRTLSGREGQLIKPDSFCVDIGLFTVEKAYEAVPIVGFARGPRIGEVPFAKKSVRELADQGSYNGVDSERGLLGSLVGSKRDAPLSPDAFATVLSKKEFTNGADSGTVINLYRNTATALLGSTQELLRKLGSMRSLRDWARRCATAARSRRWR